MSLDLYSKVQEVVRTEWLGGFGRHLALRKLSEVRLHEADVQLVNSLPERFRIQLHEAQMILKCNTTLNHMSDICGEGTTYVICVAP